MGRYFLIFLILVVMVIGTVLIGCSEEAVEEPANGVENDNGEEAEEKDPAVALIEDRCSSCHGLDRVYSDQNEGDWPEIVERMVGKSPGLLDEEEFDLMVEYLQDNYSN